MCASNYVLLCSLCREEYPSKLEWGNHLLRPRHQKKAVQNCGNWNLDCWLVVFTGMEVDKCCIFQYFSDLEGLKGGPVTDAVFTAGNNNVTVLQFESSKRVDRILGLLETRTNAIQDVPFEVRKLSDYGALERQCWLPWLQLSSSLPLVSSDAETDTTEEILIIPHSTPTPPVHEISDSEDEDEEEVGEASVPSSEEPQSPESPFGESLVADFQEICEAVEVPLNDFKKALQLTKRLQHTLEKHLEGCQLFLFRHCYLRLRCPPPGVEELLIFVRHDHQFQYKTNLSFYKKVFHGTAIITLEKAKGEGETYGKHFLDTANNVRFSLVDHGYLHTEMQTCQLINYLTKIDSRAKALMTVVRFWAAQNQIVFQNDVITKECLCAVIPSALELLVIFFLVRENVVPSPETLATAPFDRVVQERLLEPGFPLKPDWMGNHYLEDPPEYKNEAFVKSVLELSQKFFEFYGDLLQNKCGSSVSACVLNPRNGEVILMMEENNGTQVHFRNLSETKLTDKLKTMLATNWFLDQVKKDISWQLRFKAKMPISILHPLNYKRWVKICSNRNYLCGDWEAMRITGEKLKILMGTSDGNSWINGLILNEQELQRRGTKRSYED